MSEPCFHLRTKKLYIPAESDSALVEKEMPGVTSPMWCNLTQSATGPDDAAVCLRGCCDGTRRCYLGQESV